MIAPFTSTSERLRTSRLSIPLSFPAPRLLGRSLAKPSVPDRPHSASTATTPGSARHFRHDVLGGLARQACERHLDGVVLLSGALTQDELPHASRAAAEHVVQRRHRHGVALGGDDHPSRLRPVTHPIFERLDAGQDQEDDGRLHGQRGYHRVVSRNWTAELEAGNFKPTGAMAFRVENSVQVWRVEVWRTPIETLPADRPTPLAESVRLPALRLGGKGWSGHDGSAAEILAVLNRAPVDTRQPTRKNVLEQVIETGKLVSLPPRAEPSAPAAACLRLARRRPMLSGGLLDARQLVGAGATP